MGLAPVGAFAAIVTAPEGDQQAPRINGGGWHWLHSARGHYMQPTNLNLKAIARDATLRGDTKTLFHALDLLERVVPIATFMDFCTELDELRLQGARPRPH